MPVDHPQSARVAGPIPHVRKLAFGFGVLATALALFVLTRFTGLIP